MSVAAVASKNTLLQLGSQLSPETWSTIANVNNITGPGLSGNVVDVTSHSTNTPWRQKIVTLLDLGDVVATMFWVPTDSTHKNAVNGLRYIFVTRSLMTYRLYYPDGAGGTQSSFDVFDAYISKLSHVAPVDKVLEMTVTFTGTGAPDQLA